MQIGKVQSIQQPKIEYANKQSEKNPSFKGAGGALIGGMSKFFQLCDDIPMIGVAFTDTVATNVPRTAVDLKETGIPAAAETARREFSGLFVNCLIPGAFVYGASKIMNNNYMKDFVTPTGTPLNLTRSWANGEAISNLTSVWQEYSGITKDVKGLTANEQAKVIQALKDKPFGDKGFVKSALKKIEGLNGVNSWEKLSDKKAIIEEASELLSSAMKDGAPTNIFKKIGYNRKRSQALQQAYDTIINGKYTYKDAFGNKVVKIIDEAGGLKASQNLKFNGKVIGSDLKNFLRDTVDIGQALSVSKEARLNPNQFMKKAAGLVSAKSIAGLAVVVPLAMSMQYINRAITRHKYNKSGAPIYKDFENESRVLTDKEKKELKMRKPLAVASIVGLAALSMGKSFPKNLKSVANMLQFNTKFPTLNQCRLIATATFASRMLASEDPNELRESTVRDLASFAGLYFLGDYAEKLAATAIQKLSKHGRDGSLQMFNKTKAPDAYKNIFSKAAGWVKDTSIKTFDEIPSQFKGYRSLAKVGGLGFSIVLLGVLLPMYNKHVTNKKEARRKAVLEQQKKQNNLYNPKTVFPKESPVQNEQGLNTQKASSENFKSIYDFSKDPVFSNIASKFIKQ